MSRRRCSSIGCTRPTWGEHDRCTYCRSTLPEIHRAEVLELLSRRAGPAGISLHFGISEKAGEAIYTFHRETGTR